MKPIPTAVFVLTSLIAAAAPLAAQTITVDITDDISDFAPPQRVAQLPGPDGHTSFREAITAANNTPGAQTIEFAIPKDQWWLVEDMAILKLETGAFILSDDQTTVDFSTQTEFTGDTNPAGPEVGIFGLDPNGYGAPAIIVDGAFCTIRGLGFVWQQATSIGIWGGHDNRVVGCKTPSVEINGSFNGPAITGNVIGGTDPGDANDLDSVNIICRADDNIVIGNTLRNASVTGSPFCDFPQRNRIGGPTAAERNVINGFGGFGEEGFPLGVGIAITSAKDTLVEGNYIGVTADGLDRVPNWVSGVEVADSINTTIRNNLISGLWVEGADHYAGRRFGQAILVNAINADNLGVTIEGNLIGTDATGQNPILTRNGAAVAPLIGNRKARDIRIGGQEQGQGNVIAFAEANGVSVFWPAVETEVSGNSIYSNGDLGIDLVRQFSDPDGVTPNDPGDGDIGGNDLQNFPVLTSAQAGGGQTSVSGVLNSRPNLQYRVEFFASPVCGPSGYGQGAGFLGSAEATTDGAGDATFEAVLTLQAPPGSVVTATATDILTGATSEFSACIPLDGGACYADFTGDGVLDLFDFLGYVNAFNGGDPSADCDGNEDLDLFDFLCFVNAFNAGC